MGSDSAFLVEKEAMWGEMLMEVLRDNGIPCTAIPVFGAGLVIKTGIQERLNIYVPKEDLSRAEELLHELFPEEED